MYIYQILIECQSKKKITNQTLLSYYLLRLMYTVKFINIINKKEYKYHN